LNLLGSLHPCIGGYLSRAVRAPPNVSVSRVPNCVIWPIQYGITHTAIASAFQPICAPSHTRGAATAPGGDETLIPRSSTPGPPCPNPSSDSPGHRASQVSRREPAPRLPPKARPSHTRVRIQPRPHRPPLSPSSLPSHSPAPRVPGRSAARQPLIKADPARLVQIPPVRRRAPRSRARRGRCESYCPAGPARPRRRKLAPGVVGATGPVAMAELGSEKRVGVPLMGLPSAGTMQPSAIVSRHLILNRGIIRIKVESFINMA